MENLVKGAKVRMDGYDWSVAAVDVELVLTNAVTGKQTAELTVSLTRDIPKQKLKKEA